MTTSFFIRTSKNNPTASICIRITEGRGQQYRFNTGHRLLKASSWNKNTQSVRTVASESYDLINLQLRRLKAHVESKAVTAKSDGVHRTKSFYAAAIESFAVFEEAAKPKYQLQWSLSDAFERFIDFSRHHNSPMTGRRLKDSTLMTYIETARHIRVVGMIDEPLLAIDLEWYYEFIARSEDGGKDQKPLSMNYIGKHVMRALELTPHPKGIALSRDLFMIGCYTGLRVSDYSRLQADQFRIRNGKKYLEIQAKKTDKKVVVPVHPVVDEILRHYATGVPPSQVDQTINRHLKLLGEIAEIDDLIEVRRTEGGQTMTKRVPKYQLIKTHTARRSFCTNAYKAGMDCLDIMTLSGHTTEKSFLRYIKVTQEERARRIADHVFFQSKKLVLYFLTFDT